MSSIHTKTINTDTMITAQDTKKLLLAREISMIDIEPHDIVMKSRRYSFSCSFGHIWMTRLRSVLDGTGCPDCDLTNRKSAAAERAMKNLESRGIQMLDPFVATGNYARFICPNNHEWTAITNNVLRGRGCKQCHFEGRTYDVSLINEKLEERSIKIIGDYVNSQTKTLFECSFGHRWDSKPNNVLNGQGCPECNGSWYNSRSNFDASVPGWAYIILFDDFIKYGITHSLKRRLTVHKRNGNFQIVYTHLFEDGGEALDWEKRIKKTLGGKFKSREQFPNGFTETLPLSLLETLLNDYCQRANQANM